MNQLSRLRRSKGHGALSTEEIALRVVGLSHMQFGISFMPPPLSACFINVARNGRADSPRYQSWKADADSEFVIDHRPTAQPRFIANVRVTFTVERPDARRRDLDNLLKPLNDFLTRNRVIKDDAYIIDLRIKYGKPLVGKVFVEIDAA